MLEIDKTELFIQSSINEKTIEQFIKKAIEIHGDKYY